MATSVHHGQVAWWREPTRDQWHAWIAAWLGWTLDAFDFTIFVFIMLPIAQEFGVPLTAVTAVFTVTLWLRLVGDDGNRIVKVVGAGHAIVVMRLDLGCAQAVIINGHLADIAVE